MIGGLKRKVIIFVIIGLERLVIICKIGDLER
jgi:hypothetical protein